MLLVFPFSIVVAVRAALFSLPPYTFVLLCVGLLPDDVVLSNLSVPPWIFLFYFFFVLFSRTITACDGKATLIARVVVFMFVCIVRQLQFPNHLRNSTDKRGIHRLIVNFTSYVFFLSIRCCRIPSNLLLLLFLLLLQRQYCCHHHLYHRRFVFFSVLTDQVMFYLRYLSGRFTYERLLDDNY